jgi:hypothetical protein
MNRKIFDTVNLKSNIGLQKYCDMTAESRNSGTKKTQTLLCSAAVNTFRTPKDKSLLSLNYRLRFQMDKRSFERILFRSRVPTGPETKNDCAGEAQQQFTILEWKTPSLRVSLLDVATKQLPVKT